MQDNAVYFTNPSALNAALRSRMTDVASAGPGAVTEAYKEKITKGKGAGTTVTRPAHENLRDKTNKAIHALMFVPGDPEDKRKQAKDLMRTFVEAQGWHKSSKGSIPKIRSLFKERPDNMLEIAKLFEGKSGSNIADPGTTTITGSGDVNITDPSPGGGDPTAGTVNAGMMANTLTDSLGSYSSKRGLDGGYLLDAMNRTAANASMSGLAEGIVTLNDGKGEKGTIDLRRIPVADLVHIIHSGLTRKDEGGTIEKEFWTEKLAGMRIAALAPNKEGKQNVNEWAPGNQDGDQDSEKPSPNKTFRNLRQIYAVSETVGQQQLMLPKYRDILFSTNQQTGQQTVKGWLANILPPVSQGSRVGTKADVLMDWVYIETQLGKGSSDLKQFEAIFEAMSISKTERDTGDYFGVGNRLRRLALMMSEG